MIRLPVITVAFLLLVPSVPAADPDAELKAFQGKWVLEAATLAGRDHLEDFKGLTLTVTDSRGLATSANLAINVRKPSEAGSAQVSITFNAPPTVTALAASPTLLSVGQATAVTATVLDADGDTLT